MWITSDQGLMVDRTTWLIHWLVSAVERNNLTLFKLDEAISTSQVHTTMHWLNKLLTLWYQFAWSGDVCAQAFFKSQVNPLTRESFGLVFNTKQNFHLIEFMHKEHFQSHRLHVVIRTYPGQTYQIYQNCMLAQRRWFTEIFICFKFKFIKIKFLDWFIYFAC